MIFEYKNPILQTKEDAENVLAAMKTVINGFSFVTVGDLKDLVGLPKTYEEDRHGWVLLINIKILEVPTGFVLDLPKPGVIEVQVP